MFDLDARRELLESFERSGMGVLVLDEHGEVLHRSARLEGLLTGPDGAELAVRLGEIAALVPQVEPGLRSSDGTLDLRTSMSIPVGPDWYRSFVLDVGPRLLAESRTVVVAVVRSWGLPPMTSVLQSTYGLSPREAEVAQALLRGQSNKAIATALQLSRNTTRNHTARVFAKLGVRRRAEAASLLLGEFTSPSGRARV